MLTILPSSRIHAVPRCGDECRTHKLFCRAAESDVYVCRYYRVTVQCSSRSVCSTACDWRFQGSKPSKAAASSAAAAAKDEPPAETVAKSEVEEEKVNEGPRLVDNIVVSIDDGYARPNVSRPASVDWLRIIPGSSHLACDARSCRKRRWRLRQRTLRCSSRRRRIRLRERAADRDLSVEGRTRSFLPTSVRRCEMLRRV